MKIVIIFQSGYGHTKIVAEHIQKGALRILANVIIFYSGRTGQKGPKRDRITFKKV